MSQSIRKLVFTMVSTSWWLTPIVAQIHHGTAIVAASDATSVLIAADSRENTDGVASDYCKIAISGNSVIGIANVSGVKRVRFVDFFTHSEAFRRPLSAQQFHAAALGWGNQVKDFLETEMREHRMHQIGAGNLITSAIFYETDQEKRLLSVNVVIRATPQETKARSNIVVAVSDGIVIHPDGEHAVYAIGHAGVLTWNELLTARTSRAQAQQRIVRDLVMPGGSLATRSKGAEELITLASSWYPEEVSPPIAEITISGDGPVWKAKTPACLIWNPVSATLTR
jgi:hypothetical protein